MLQSNLEEILDQVRHALEMQDISEAVTLIEQFYPPDQAELISELTDESQQRLLPQMNPDDAAEMLAEMDEKEAAELVGALSTSDAIRIVDEMEPDAAVDVLGSMEPEQAQAVLDDQTCVLGALQVTGGGLVAVHLSTQLRDRAHLKAITGHLLRQIRQHGEGGQHHRFGRSSGYGSTPVWRGTGHQECRHQPGGEQETSSDQTGPVKVPNPRKPLGELLVAHPVGGCFLGVPGLQQLFGKGAQLGRICCCVNSPAETLDLKFLAHTQFDIGMH